MSTTTVRPEVETFLARVRAHLVDLTEEQRDELLDGLAADLGEQLTAGDALPDPAAYAAELRSAAGLAPASRWPATGNLLDRGRAAWERVVAENEVTRAVGTLAETLRPAWWVARAWIAVTLLDQATGPWEYVGVLPTLGVPLLGPALLLVAVAVSVLIGRGRLWPGSGPDRSVTARVALLALNVLAVLAPLTFTGDGSQVVTLAQAHAEPVRAPVREDVLRHGREVVRNIYAYDANGQPLSGVQLFDQAGRPVAVSPVSSQGRGKGRRVTCPWFNGETGLYNVFPLPERLQRRGTCASPNPPKNAGDATAPTAPFAAVPPVSATRSVS
jgi:hypothetical protein